MAKKLTATTRVVTATIASVDITPDDPRITIAYNDVNYLVDNIFNDDAAVGKSMLVEMKLVGANSTDADVVSVGTYANGVQRLGDATMRNMDGVVLKPVKPTAARGCHPATKMPWMA